MNDIKLIPGKKEYSEDLFELVDKVRSLYPDARREGSSGCWYWYVGDKIVAEAWIHRTEPGWWIRIK